MSLISIHIGNIDVWVNIIMDPLTLITDVGFPAAAAAISGYFVFLSLKFILAGVLNSVKGIEGMLKRLDRRVSTMNNDIHKLDIRISHALGIQPNYDRVSRAKPEDQRID